jgi:NADPH:quinone reductase-like Zn-dependent oxidoreductase
MRVLEIQSAFGLENLRFTERPELHPGPGQVVVWLRAASLKPSWRKRPAAAGSIA